MSSSRYPSREALLLAWSRQHADLWKGGQSGAPDTGLSAQQISDFDDAVTAAEAAFSTRAAKLSAAKAATTAKNEAFETMIDRLGSCLSTIDSVVKDTKDPSYYVRAEIDPPKDPSERPAPPKPSEVELTAITGGSMEIAFKVNAAGAVFEIQRSSTPIGGQPGEWATIAITGEKVFTDPGLAVGLQGVQYRVRAVLPNNNASPWSSPATFAFGAQGSQGGPATRERAG
ncbi:MAG: hypothetical protein ACIAS6_04385 [Phycisphaerales bacterium JB060]